MATIKDIVQLTGFSPTTISRVLNNTADRVGISKRTQERIWEAARQLNYTPNSVARSLKTGLTNIVALVVRDIANPFFAEVAGVVQRELSKHGYDLLLYNTANPSGHHQERELGFVGLIERWPVAGLVICQDTPLEERVLVRLRERGTPTVMISPIMHEGIDAVYVDDEQAAFDAVSYLASRGHRTIAHIAGSTLMATGQARLRGYTRALHERGLPMCPELVQPGEFTLDGGARAMQRLLRMRPRPTAVYAANDIMAFAALKTALQAGVAVPGEVAIMGFDNVNLLAYPELSTVDHNQEGLGREAAHLLLRRLRGEGPPTKEVIVLPHRLVIRSTT